ncbi:MAG: hypothetical protein ABIH41_01580 [Nanoarchaeota archaeon]
MRTFQRSQEVPPVSGGLLAIIFRGVTGGITFALATTAAVALITNTGGQYVVDKVQYALVHASDPIAQGYVRNPPEVRIHMRTNERGEMETFYGIRNDDIQNLIPIGQDLIPLNVYELAERRAMSDIADGKMPSSDLLPRLERIVAAERGGRDASRQSQRYDRAQDAYADSTDMILQRLNEVLDGHEQ